MEDKRSFFSQIFTSMMVFSLLVGVCTAAFIYSWPWEKTNPQWRPTFRIIASCGEKKDACGFAYQDLMEAKNSGKLAALEPAEAVGEIEEAQGWLKWRLDNGVYEVKSSSWWFQSTIRYRVENAEPVLIAFQDVEVSKAFTYGLGAAVFMMFGLNLRKLRR